MTKHRPCKCEALGSLPSTTNYSSPQQKPQSRKMKMKGSTPMHPPFPYTPLTHSLKDPS